MSREMSQVQGHIHTTGFQPVIAGWNDKARLSSEIFITGRTPVVRGKTILLLGTAMLLAGCTSSADHLNQPFSLAVPGTLKLADAKPLDDLDTDENVQVDLTDKLAPPLASMQVYFGQADAFDSDENTTPAASVPVIALHLGSQWKAVPVVGPGLADAGWKYVGAGPSPREIWGLLDTSTGDSQGNFVLAHSTDGASSFNLQEFHKPCKLAAVYDFAMSRSGHGRITLSLDTDCGSHKAGLYHYDTNDDGKTWPKIPRYEPDSMIRADAVTDDEQPAITPEQKPVQTLYFHRHANRHHAGLLTSR